MKTLTVIIAAALFIFGASCDDNKNCPTGPGNEEPTDWPGELSVRLIRTGVLEVSIPINLSQQLNVSSVIGWAIDRIEGSTHVRAGEFSANSPVNSKQFLLVEMNVPTEAVPRVRLWGQVGAQSLFINSNSIYAKADVSGNLAYEFIIDSASNVRPVPVGDYVWR